MDLDALYDSLVISLDWAPYTQQSNRDHHGWVFECSLAHQLWIKLVNGHDKCHKHVCNVWGNTSRTRRELREDYSQSRLATNPVPFGIPSHFGTQNESVFGDCGPPKTPIWNINLIEIYLPKMTAMWELYLYFMPYIRIWTVYGRLIYGYGRSPTIRMSDTVPPPLYHDRYGDGSRITGPVHTSCTGDGGQPYYSFNLMLPAGIRDSESGTIPISITQHPYEYTPKMYIS